jgi:hypothetical protein
VNCPRRTWDFYRKIKDKLKNENSLDIIVNGYNWNLASNAIHFIDLFAYLSDNIDILTIDNSGLNKKPLLSKRKNYYEVSGKLLIKFSGNNCLILNSTNDKNTPLSVTIITEKKKIIIYEVLSYYLEISNPGNETKRRIISKKIQIPFQSQLTQRIAKDLIEKNVCPLTSIRESVKLHEPLVTSLMDFFHKNLAEKSKKKSSVCPIT